MINHFTLMAQYNQRMNCQLIDVLNELSHEVLTSDKGAYFGSVLGTLNHILVGDLIWLARFSAHSSRYCSLLALSDLPKPVSLDHALCPNLESFKNMRKHVDLTIKSWLSDEVIEDDFTFILSYANTKGVVSKRNFGELVSHLFNHQTHHRGQVSTLLNQLGLDLGVTDFLMDIPDASL